MSAHSREDRQRDAPHFKSMRTKDELLCIIIDRPHTPAVVSGGWLSVWHGVPGTAWQTLWLPLCPPGRSE